MDYRRQRGEGTMDHDRTDEETGLTPKQRTVLVTLLRRAKAARAQRNARRRAWEAVRLECGLVKVRGNLGGVYWE
jgi:hypothetical protein